jgi:hypothetical protein
MATYDYSEEIKVEHFARMGEKRNPYRVLVGKSESNKPLRRADA